MVACHMKSLLQHSISLLTCSRQYVNCTVLFQNFYLFFRSDVVQCQHYSIGWLGMHFLLLTKQFNKFAKWNEANKDKKKSCIQIDSACHASLQILKSKWLGTDKQLYLLSWLLYVGERKVPRGATQVWFG